MLKEGVCRVVFDQAECLLVREPMLERSGAEEVVQKREDGQGYKYLQKREMDESL